MAILVVKPNKHFSWWLNYAIATLPTLQHLQSCSVTIKAGICFPSAISVIEIEYQTEVSQSLLRCYNTGAKGLAPTSAGKSDTSAKDFNSYFSWKVFTVKTKTEKASWRDLNIQKKIPSRVVTRGKGCTLQHPTQIS